MKKFEKFLFNFFLVFVTFLSVLLKSCSCERNYRHSKEELKLIKVIKIPQTSCKKNEIPVFIHSAARSSGKYYDRRQTTRKTWVKDAVDNKMKVIFVIGLPEDEKTQKDLERESSKYKDMLQFGFNDNYYNLTLKAMSILRWITKNCRNSDYVLKTDDDVLVNVEKFKRMTDNKQFGSGLTGRVLRVNSNRVLGHKWFMPKEFYTKNRYIFLWGFSYVMSNDIIRKLYKTASNYSGPVLDIDDLFMTGVIADKARIRKYDSSLFGNYCGSNACYMNNMLVFHGCDSVNQTFEMWKYYKRTSAEECERFYRFFRY
jgi:hypothetical protein